MSDLGKRVRKIRNDLHMTQEEFGAKIGLKKNSLSQIESGKNQLTSQTMITICKVFNVSESWLQTGEGDPFVKVTKEDEIMDLIKQSMSKEPEAIKRRFAAAVMKLSSEQIRLCINWIFDNLTQMPEDDKPAAVDIKPKK